MLVRQLLHIRFSWVLAKCSQHLPNLGHLNLAITLLVKDAESLLKFCGSKHILMLYMHKVALEFTYFYEFTSIMLQYHKCMSYIKYIYIYILPKI